VIFYVATITFQMTEVNKYNDGWWMSSFIDQHPTLSCREEVYGRWKQLLASGEATSHVLSWPSDLTLSPNLLRPLPVQTDRQGKTDKHSLSSPSQFRFSSVRSDEWGVLGDIYFWSGKPTSHEPVIVFLVSCWLSSRSPLFAIAQCTMLPPF
jgi:hypothetical protein